MDTIGSSYTEISFGQTSPEDNVLPSPPFEGINPLEEPEQAETFKENHPSEQDLSQGSPDGKSQAASHDQTYDTNGDDLRLNSDGNMSKDKEQKEIETVEKKAEKIPEQVSRYGHYLRMMGEQMIQWEKEILKKGLKQDNGEESKPTKDRDLKRHPATPKIGRVSWEEFKNRIVADKQHPAIEVLVGEPRFYYQRRKDEKQQRQGTTSESYLQEEVKEEISVPMSLASIPYKEVPERIRINSIPIIRILSDIASEAWLNMPTTLLKPYKILQGFEKEIRQALCNLEEKWADFEKSEEGGPQSQPCELNTEKSGVEHIT